MNKCRTALLGAAALGALALGAPAANATFYVFYSTDNGATYTALNPGGSAESPPSTTIGNFNFTAGNISIGTSSFSTDAPNTGSTANSFVTNSQLAARNTGNTTSAIKFAIVDNAFTGPTSGTLSNAITLINNGGLAGNVITGNACVNNNAVVPTTGTVDALCTGSPFNAPTATLTSTTATAAQSNTTTLPGVTSLSTPFTIAEFFTLSLVGGANVDATGTASLQANVPEPVSLSLLAVGLIGLGAAGGMRRKA